MRDTGRTRRRCRAQVPVGKLDRRRDGPQVRKPKVRQLIVEAMQRTVHLLQARVRCWSVSAATVGDPSAWVRSRLPCSKARRGTRRLGQRQEAQLADSLRAPPTTDRTPCRWQLGHGFDGLGCRVTRKKRPARDRSSLALFRIEDGATAPCAAEPAAPDRVPSGPRSKARGSDEESQSLGRPRARSGRITEIAPGKCASEGRGVPRA